MNYKECLRYLNNWKTKKGNFKKEGVLILLENLCNKREKTERVCPHCNGKGQYHSPCAFGGSGDYFSCYVCNGTGEI